MATICGQIFVFGDFDVMASLFSFSGRYRILHLTWVAFFLTFVCWFNFVPFATTVAKELSLSEAQVKILAICNLALTIPARIIIGMLLDKFGPRVTFSMLLGFAIVPCLGTALSQDFNQLVISRLLMGLVGAGFVVGIRMVSEWFDAKDIGFAEGIYGGWGNFGAFGAKFGLPLAAVTLAGLGAGAGAWRWTIALTGVIAAIYGLIYYKNVQDTPAGQVYARPKKASALEVTNVQAFWGMMVMNLILVSALGVLAWQLGKVKFLSPTGTWITWGLIGLLYAYQSYQAWQVNRDLLTGQRQYEPQNRYQFRQVALLELTYITNFGSELATVSMLPKFFESTFGLDATAASLVAASYSFLNLFSRPTGGIISDRLGSRKWTMVLISFGIGISYLTVSKINASWGLPVAVAAVMVSAFFAQAGCGATFGMVPLIKREVTGQIAGNVGAYGNFGGVIYLTVFSLTNAPTFFAFMGIAGMICTFLCSFFLQEPQGKHAAVAMPAASNV
jgi:MFS transporter, NNP family, nitrate/nitrite transporter